MLLASLVLLAQAGPAQQPEVGQTVVVTARSLKDTERDLVECLARRCSPKEDIEASLAHGENLFLAGDFAGARTTLGRSRNRNIRYARELPIEVSDLTRAYGRMATFDGYEGPGRMAQIDSLDALKAGLDSGDARILMQRMMVGDEYARIGRLVAAEDVYDTVEKQARKAGLPRVLGFAMLRQAVVFGAVASVEPLYRQRARAKITRLERTTEPELAEFRDAVGVLKARLAGLEGDERGLEAAIEQVARRRPPRPVLVHAPGVELDLEARSNSTVVGENISATPQWIDVAFDIEADGRVREISVLRRSSNVFGNWPDRVRDALLKRRYTPPAPGTTAQRVERFAYVANVVPVKGTRIPGRSATGRIVTLDLTVDPPAS